MARKRVPLAALAPATMLVAACVAEPSQLCDRDQLVWSFDEIEVGPEQDVSDEPGIQIDVLVRTSLDPGTLVSLAIVSHEGSEIAAREPAREDGIVLFQEVTVPLGSVTLRVSGFGSCRELTSERDIFVFDELGRPECVLALAQAALESDVYAPAAVLNAAADGDPDAPGFQAGFAVSAGRPDVLVRLLVLDAGTGVETSLSAPAGDDRAAEFEVTLGEGLHAVRAVCEWEQSLFPQTTPIRTYFVDTIPPSCELLEPTAAVGPEDDLDGDLENGIQFPLRGRAGGGDVAGEPAGFSVEGAELSGSPIGEDGESEAVGELPHPAPQVQRIGFSAVDHAGNACEIEVLFEQ